MSNKTLMGYPAVDPKVLRAIAPEYEPPAMSEFTKTMVANAKQRWNEQIGTDVLPEPGEPFSDSLIDKVDTIIKGLPQGSTLRERANTAARKLIGEDNLKRIRLLSTLIPPTPKYKIKGSYSIDEFDGEGWYKLDKLGSPIRVEYPTESVLFYDTETYVLGSEFPMANTPIIGTAATATGELYIHLHEVWFQPDEPYQPKLLPIGPHVKILIAHNARFDVIRTEEFYQDKCDILVIDTFSLHQKVSGMTSNQMKSPNKPKHGCRGDLISLLEHHLADRVNRTKDAKDTREYFVKCNINEMLDHFAEIIKYSLQDAADLIPLTQILLMKYFEQIGQDNMISLYGMLAVSFNSVKADDNIIEWYHKCEKLYHEANHQFEEIIKAEAKNVYKAFLSGDVDPESDPWLSQLDWSMNTKLKNYEIRCAATPGKWEKEPSPRTGKPIIAKRTYKVPQYPELYGKPRWYITADKKDAYGAKTQLAHVLARLTYKDYPVLYNSEVKYHIVDDTGEVIKIPHMKNLGANVGGVLNQSYVEFFETGAIKSQIAQGQELLDLAIKVCYWTSMRGRIDGTIIYNGKIVTDHVPHQTITGRAGSPVLSTVPSPGPNDKKIGNEVRLMLIAPPEEQRIVCFDVTAQEAFIAALIASKFATIPVLGITPFGYMQFAGNKHDKTDAHSNTARKLGALIGLPNYSRDSGKQLNYALNYFCGVTAATKTIWKEMAAHIPDQALAKSAAVETLQYMRGTKKLRSSYYEEQSGTHTEFFNGVLSLMEDPTPATPLLGVRLPLPIQTRYLPRPNAELTSRFNAFIQGSGADFMHTMITLTDYFNNHMGLDAKFLIPYHDEYGWLVAKSDAYKVAQNAAVAHLLSWAMLIEALGLVFEIPTVLAFPESIEIMDRFAKEGGSIKTPSWEGQIVSESLQPEELFSY
jgi:hypothetical protein